MNDKPFFSRYPDYVVAERFLSRVYKGMQTNDADLKRFSEDVWNKFDPSRDDRLSYIKSFWEEMGIRMDGTYESFWKLEDWIWNEAEHWRIRNPRPPCTKTPIGAWVPSREAIEEIASNDLVSLSRDVAIYHAFCIASQASIAGTWKKWIGKKSEVMRGFPFFEISNCPHLARIQNVQAIYSKCVRLTTEFTPDVALDAGAWTLSVASYVERASGINLPKVGAPHETRHSS